jgi:hypothetical protein
MISLVVFVGLMVFMMGLGVVLTWALHGEWCTRAPTPRSQPHRAHCVCAACYQQRLQQQVEEATYEEQQKRIQAAAQEASKL